MTFRKVVINSLVCCMSCSVLVGVCRAFQSGDVSIASKVPPSRDSGTVPAGPAATSPPAIPAPSPGSAPAPDFVIGPSDVLMVNVWRESEISRTVPVRPDGKISLPLVGDLKASGFTAEQLQGNIKRELQEYLSNPEVTVIVQEVKSQQVNVFGEVVKPGAYVLSKNMTVLDAIALAGGMKDFAKITKVYVLRLDKDGNRIKIPFNYKAVIKGRNPGQDISLQARDSIIVP